MYNVLFVCLYILGTKHDIFQINTSLIRKKPRDFEMLEKSILDSETSRKKKYETRDRKSNFKRKFET